VRLGVLALALFVAPPVALAGHAMPTASPDYLPDEAGSKVVSVAAGEGSADAAITVLTQAVAIKETGPRKTVARFGEVYVFAPAFLAVHRDEPTAITFWNLQPDDEHDFMLADPDLEVRMKVTLPPLQRTPYVFTFHREGLFTFYCTMHQPAMSGQILVLPPAAR